MVKEKLPLKAKPLHHPGQSAKEENGIILFEKVYEEVILKTTIRSIDTEPIVIPLFIWVFEDG